MIFQVLTWEVMVCGWFGTSSVKPTVLSLQNALDAKAARAPVQVPGSQAAELSKCAGNCSWLSVTTAAQTKVAAFRRFLTKTPLYSQQWQQTLQKPTNSGQFTTPEILLLSTLSIQAVLAGATHSAVTLCDI